MKNRLLLSIVAVAVILFSACSILQGQHADGRSDGTKDFDQSVKEKYWKLIEINGQAISGNFNKEPHFILKNEDNRVNGNGGCNGFGGTYTLSEETNRISFSELFSTKMACPDMSVEQAFMDILSKADNYSLNGDTLTLNKARMAPLAKFVAVYF